MNLEQFLRGKYLGDKSLAGEDGQGKESAFQAMWTAQAKTVKQLGQFRDLHFGWLEQLGNKKKKRDEEFTVGNVVTLIPASNKSNLNVVVIQSLSHAQLFATP